MSGPVVLHVNDAASTAAQLLTEARRRGLDWRYQPLASGSWDGALGRTARAARGAAWLARLGARAARSDLLHVHGGTVVRHSGLVPRRYVLHVHGTDVRSHQYDPAQRTVVLRGLARAEAVLYSTPDLAEHVLPHRADAEHLPQPLDLAALPAWAPADPPLVLFASRWEQVKGLPAQLALARALRAALPASTRLAGLDWGPGAPAAAAAGVELLGRRPREGYLALLASASVVVGQASGMLAASELEALALGVPVAAALEPRWYPALDGPPVLLGRRDGAAGQERAARATDDLVSAVLAALGDPVATSAALGGPAWAARHHDVRAGVDRLERLYARVLDGGSAQEGHRRRRGRG